MPKTILITGGNDGIGYAAAQWMLELGHEVILAGRNPDKLREAVSRLGQKNGRGKASWIQCDLASQTSIMEAGMYLQESYPKLDVLVNNAGVFTDTLEFTRDGVELQFGVNHLGHFLLTQTLLPMLLEHPGGRVVNVSSVAHYSGKIDFDNLRGERGAAAYKGMVAYSQSKLANVLFTRELARRFPELSSNCLHPGVVRTRIANKRAGWLTGLAWNLYKPFMRSVRCGAKTTVYLALSQEVNDVRGRYFDEKQHCKKPSDSARDEALALRLWEESEKLVGF